jgi:malic enzyme
VDHRRIEVRPTSRIENADDLAKAYSPGVAKACRAIADAPEAANELTTRANTVAIVSDGSAVLGLGDIGPLAALPVLEGKAALFKRFAGIDAWPLCLNTRDTGAMVDAIAAVATGLGGINLEDIAAPHCFEVERRAASRGGRPGRAAQINNVLAFPGVFRGLLDAHAAEVTTAAQCAAADAIASVVDDLDADHIVPSVFDERLVPAVARAVAGA